MEAIGAIGAEWRWHWQAEAEAEAESQWPLHPSAVCGPSPFHADRIVAATARTLHCTALALHWHAAVDLRFRFGGGTRHAPLHTVSPGSRI